MSGRSRIELPDHRTIFEAVESSLIREGSCHLLESEVRSRLDEFKQVEGKRFTDAQVFRYLVEIAFYSGFRAATVTGKLEVIHRHFPDYETVAGFGEKEIQQILDDPAMIRNRRKVQACVGNAQALQRIVREYGAFQAYVDSFSPKESEGNLLRLRQELQGRFSYLGRITSYHFLMEIGMPVLKPDRVICRIFHRLGLIESTNHTLEAIEQGRRFAEATGHPIRCIDIVFVLYGQAQSMEFGLARGICLKDNPNCTICGVRGYCNHSGRRLTGET
jgi:DNA-3-methyladenine glycosylase I